ncbi:substrate-binding domain-containing protein [Diplocloster agilis]|uniref:Substrate-binding domain-containing protein n=1 Tax=Diplocloster agilis TaxID=2850323 RepID=A0A949JUM5_9FIRM|nr:substrate-binding domain-containing protein [Diplocloster agilis]MBU9735440.1 substrate-binding domain-containing protein [Diplocloster agilis]
MKKTRKILSLILGLLIIAAAAAGCGKKEELPAGPAEPAAVEMPEAPPAEPAAPVESEKPAEPEQTPAEEKGVLLMATTTSTDDTGLLDYLKPIFLADTGWDLQWDAVGTGEALKMGENGDVAVVLVHAKASEEEFIAGGYGVERFPVMYNDFIVAGPAQPIAHTDNIEAVFSRIIKEQLPFVSRGDDSGTDKKEKQIWKKLALDPAQDPEYVESGQGMGATLTMADEMKAYCLTDRGTYLKMKKDATVPLELEIVCEGDANLLNQYGVIAVNPDKYPDINNVGANDFIDWICSEKVQQLIGEFGVEEYGQALFVPNAGTDS